MRTGRANPVVSEEKTVSSVLLAITQARAGAATVVDKKGKLVGIFTDGDLRRHLGTNKDLPGLKIKEVMTKNPMAIPEGKLAIEAMRILKVRKIDEMPVVDKNRRPIGLLDVQDLLKAGLV
jgi:arabinose-5-phosphate isomerase